LCVLQEQLRGGSSLPVMGLAAPAETGPPPKPRTGWTLRRRANCSGAGRSSSSMALLLSPTESAEVEVLLRRKSNAAVGDVARPREADTDM
jgi:hypothetical protein